jgi:hypothetical protein
VKHTQPAAFYIAKTVSVLAKPSKPCHARQAGSAKHSAAQLCVQLQKLCRSRLQHKFANKEAQTPVAHPIHSQTAGV